MPEKKSDSPPTFYNRTFKDKIESKSTKGSRYRVAAFLLLSLSYVWSGCDSSGSVGGNLGPDDDAVENFVIDLDSHNYITAEANSFSGGLPNSATGYVEDPLYGTIKAVALLKPPRPSVVTTGTGSIDPDELIDIRLKLKFHPAMHGDTLSLSNFDIYEVAGTWRSSEIRYNDDKISVNLSSKVGEFRVGREDSLEVRLSDAWQQKYINILRDTTGTSAERDSLYTRTFPGLALVPSEQNRKLRFLDHSSTSTNQEFKGTVFMFEVEEEEEEEEEEETENEEEEEEEEEILPTELQPFDWASSFVRTSAPEVEEGEGIVLHNTERLLKVDLNPDIPVEDLQSKDIVSARLVFSMDTEADQQHPGFHRPIAQGIWAHRFRSEPSDPASEIFVREPTFFGREDIEEEEEENIFVLDITQYVLDEVFGEGNGGSLYISVQDLRNTRMNGVLYTTRFYGQNGPANRKPRLIITSVKDR